MSDTIRFRKMAVDELERIRDIDREEVIRVGYQQDGDQLIRMDVDWDTPNWGRGEGEHTHTRIIRFAKHYLETGATAIGAFAGDRLAGIAIYQPEVEESMGQLALMHVSREFRRRGIAARLFEDVLRLSQTAGDARLYVSATPSGSAVGFYLSRGFRPTATPHPELLAEEPEDIHMILELADTEPAS